MALEDYILNKFVDLEKTNLKGVEAQHADYKTRPNLQLTTRKKNIVTVVFYAKVINLASHHGTKSYVYVLTNRNVDIYFGTRVTR